MALNQHDMKIFAKLPDSTRPYAIARYALARSLAIDGGHLVTTALEMLQTADVYKDLQPPLGTASREAIDEELSKTYTVVEHGAAVLALVLEERELAAQQHVHGFSANTGITRPPNVSANVRTMTPEEAAELSDVQESM